MINIHNMRRSDVAAGMNLCRLAGWNQVEADWNLFLDRNEEGCFVATDEERVVGTATTIVYGDRFAWIGMVLVDPQFRRLGIGTMLLNTAIHHVRHLPCIKLDATPAGREVYKHLGFVDEYTLSRFVANQVNPFAAASPQISLSDLDFNFVASKDLDVFGADRSFILKRWISREPSLAIFDRLSGAYCFAREGHHYLHLGPIVADDFMAAQRICSAALNRSAGRPVMIDATHHSPQWLDWLYSLGFSEQRPFTRMYLGKNVYPGLPRHQFAICGPEFG